MDPPKPRPSSPADVSPAPAPWELQTKLYLFTRLISPDKSTREDPILQGLPPGSYNTSETVHPSALAPINDRSQWKGGLAHVVLVRYEDSPVGPYDELIMLSGGWSSPYEKRTSSRITNIYVSTHQSIWNGRRNWNIPKHLARFEFVPTGSRTSTFKAFLPDAEKPFFAASVTDSYLPGVPLPAFVLNPLIRMVQPPLAGDPADESPDEWIAITPAYLGRWRVAYIRPAETETGLERYGDGLQFPQVNPYWVGAKFTGLLQFPVGDRQDKQ